MRLHWSACNLVLIENYLNYSSIMSRNHFKQLIRSINSTALRMRCQSKHIDVLRDDKIYEL